MVMHLLPFMALVQSDIGSPVLEISQQRFLLVIQTRARFAVMDQNVAHQLHLPLLKNQQGARFEPVLGIKNNQITHMCLNDASVQPRSGKHQDVR